jgi:hypothetical protein
MGLKQVARAVMEENGVPILPGSPGLLKSLEEAVEIAERSISGHAQSHCGRWRAGHARGPATG